MKLQYKIIPVVLIFVLILAACRDSKKDDLFQQEPGEKTLSQDTDKAESVPTPAGLLQEETALAAAAAEDNNEKPAEDSQKDKKEEQEGTMDTLSENIDEAFSYEKISDVIKERINGKSYAKDCKVPYSDLRYVKVLHYGFDGKVHEGELIVNKDIAEDIVEIFKELYEIKYPIEKMVLIDEYNADDNASMADNNTSAFNYRVVEGTDRISKHGYGLAIDINPLYNPYIHTIDGETVITPVNGIQYADRSLDCEYYIKKDDALYNAFIKRGFTWGGEWKNSKDYQHFQKVTE